MTPDYTTLQQGTGPDPLEIERSLDGLWREYSRQQHEEEGGVVRARLANLISFCRTPKEAEAASAAVAALNASRPVRSIVVTADPEHGGEPTAEVALKCSRFNGRPVCFEEVGLTTPGDSTRTLPSLLEPLTIADLPVYLWFPGDPPLDEPVMDRLLPLADRVVTDSHSFGDPLERFHQVNDKIEAYRGKALFTELSWTRLGTWREAVGKLFDPADHREHLRSVRAVTVTSTRGAGIPSDRALLMVAWLASRLGWQPSHGNGGRESATFLSGSGKVNVEWKEGDAPIKGHLLGIEIETDGAVFRVERIKGDPAGSIQTVISRDGGLEVGPAYRPLHWEIHELLCHELEIRSPFRDWEDAVAVLAALREAQE